MMSFAIECNGISRRFGDFVAVDKLDLKVKENSIFGFLGPNGAGKTTTIKMLTGTIKPSEGDAMIAGHSILKDSKSVHAIMGYLPEEPCFYEWMNGESFLQFIGNLFKIPNVEDRVSRLLKDAGLYEVRKRKIKKYSKGMKQRLGIAQALINDPKVLFLDEPCSALDPIGRLEVLNMITKIKEKTTVFMSSHILADIDRICDSVGILDKGCLIMQSSISELRDRFAKPMFKMVFEQEPIELERKLKKLDFVDGVKRNKEELVVYVNDVERAKNELLSCVISEHAPPLKYELASPTLEDIFINLVGQ